MSEHKYLFECTSLMEEWDYEKNSAEGLDPKKLFRSSRLRANWICKTCGHQWTTGIANRGLHNSGCPKCNHALGTEKKSRTAVKNNPLDPNDPIMLDWDYEENEKIGITPENISRGSGKRVNFKCHKCGYKWSSKLLNRTLLGRGCPCCANRVVVPGVNDLATKRPDIAKEWDYERNKCGPDQVQVGSDAKYYWICPTCNQSYLAAVSKRTAKKNPSGCPDCNQKKARIHKYQTMLKTNGCISDPKLLAEWDYEKNKIKPTELTKNSATKVWWLCPKGHSYEATVANRNYGKGCPFCSGRKILSGFNDLATKHPEIMIDWDPSNTIDPHTIASSSREPAKWICHICGYQWTTQIRIRANGHTECPKCWRNKRKKEEN